jgi:hypothetical protein
MSITADTAASTPPSTPGSRDERQTSGGARGLGSRQRSTALARLSTSVIDIVESSEKWPLWQQADARLDDFDDLQGVRDAWSRRDDRCYQVVAALTALGSRRGGDDDDAALAVVVLLEDGVHRLATTLRDVCELEDVTATVWVEVKAAEPHVGRQAAAYLLRRTRQRLCRPAAGMIARVATTSLDAHSDHEQDGLLSERPVEDPTADLTDLLVWARRKGVLTGQDVDLLVELIAAENDGLGREEAQRVVGERHGLAMRTVRRRRNRTTVQLRDAAPQYLAAIA